MPLFFHYILAELDEILIYFELMNLDNLTQYNKRKFKKLFGLYVKETRQALKLSPEQMAAQLCLTGPELRQIEYGQKSLTQSTFDHLRYALNLNDQDLLDIARITQAEMLMAVYREINEQYPK